MGETTTGLLEGIMENRGMAGFIVAICLVLALMLLNGCGGATPSRQQTGLTQTQQNVQAQGNTEYFLQQAGFKRYQVNQNMPQQEALLSALPKRTLVTYERDGEKLHAYGDKDTRTLYIGNEAAYQKYLAQAQGKNICEQQVGGGESAKFWNCMDEYRQKGGGQPGK
jgi:hypothetical protein